MSAQRRENISEKHSSEIITMNFITKTKLCWSLLLKQMVQGGGKDQQRRGDSSNSGAACLDSLISSHGVFVSVVGLEGGLV
jgi:hypothetical protein